MNNKSATEWVISLVFARLKAVMVHLKIEQIFQIEPLIFTFTKDAKE